MYRPGARLVTVFAAILLQTVPTVPQTAPPQTQPSQSSTTNPTAPATTFQTATRMVTLEVVVKDRQGHHVSGMKVSDLQIFEQTPSRGKEKREQKITAFREVRMAELAAQARSATQVPPGVYANPVLLQKDPVPPTILLVDGLNTELQHQAQVHRQMLKMLRSLPSDVPIAVFLFGNGLRMLQDFTTDPKLLQAALEKVTSAAGTKVATIDPRDDPGELSALLDKIGSAGGSGAAAASTPRLSAELISNVKMFEQRVYAAIMDTRVQRTIDALTSLAHHVAGYPGRKNLLWVSTTFPIYLRPLDPLKPELSGYRNYWEQLQRLNGVLSDARVAVYPINPAGVQTPEFYNAGTRPRDVSAAGASDALDRETMMLANEQDTMQTLAEGTGGKVCMGDNDLGDCIRKAVDDSSEFYDIAYYPDSPSWNGDYRAITLKTRQPGLRLAYRQGYFARLRADPKEQKTELRRAACEDYLNATSIFLAAKSLPPDSPEKLKFYLMINVLGLTLRPTEDGGRDLNFDVAVCTFDKKGNSLQLMSDSINRKLNAGEVQSLTANGLAHIVSIPGPKPAAVRLLVRDVWSGRLGSVNVKVDDSLAAPPTAAPGNNAEKPPAAH